MMLLRFDDPAKLKTKKIVFEDIFCAHDAVTLEQLKELSSRRGEIGESIKKKSFITEAVVSEMAGGVTSRYQQDLQNLENYLPLLQNLLVQVELLSNNSMMLGWISDLQIRWTSVLSASSVFKIGGPKYFRFDNLRYELGMTHFLYGATLRERALEMLSADLVQSTTLYRKAAGIYHYLSNDLFPSLPLSHESSSPSPLLAQENPPEATSSISSIMSLICLAEAQAVTIRKAEEKGSSASLLAKLHYGITELFDEATSILKSRARERNYVSARFMEFIFSSGALHKLRSHRCLANDLMEVGQVGFAIKVLQLAMDHSKEKMPKEESWRAVFKQEMDAIGELLRKYEHENEVVWHEKLPRVVELPKLEGKRIVSAIPYHPERWERNLIFILI
eukprot:TRINITY_DN20962_c0_g1_i1.p1 TRINITY_DN20962_c0_g1~~TRINITY_DN20962_c0_g1_i1.p1  ORF type:complete len:391 (-),score=60.22 TRINITY_DN20962_c0_g1_i1:193-1365(-)